ncbi:hypothetical protein StoSoilB13_09080 [Arthrobacter sp. StoSoilB13]|nr:hypothetical protein StoSoilB13_09080 [Arthrobacter sp. StoSoilB13]
MTTTEESVHLWQPDILGTGYERLELPLSPDEEGPGQSNTRQACPARHSRNPSRHP